MSPLDLSPFAVQLLSAALRHARDAEWLADPRNPGCSLDQAYHLAGYGPECARKATLSRREFDKTIGHRFRAGTEGIIDLISTLDPHAHRYALRDWALRYPSLAEWREDVRYEPTGTYLRPAVSALVLEARQAVDAVVLALWADGRIPIENPLW